MAIQEVQVTNVTEETTTVSSLNDEFQTVTYTGDANTSQEITFNNITNEIDFIWQKSRSVAQNHRLLDSIRGIDKILLPNTTGAESTSSTFVSATSANRVTFGDADSNNSTVTYVAWCASLPNKRELGKWDGAPVASQTMSNDFMSVISHTESGTNTYSTVAHGLGSRPELIIQKLRTNTSNWITRLETLDFYMSLNTSDAKTVYDLSLWSDDKIIKSLLDSVPNDEVISYCFKSVPGKCKVGSFTGNAGTTTISTLGFDPAWIMFKRTDIAGNWVILDSVRDTGTNDSLFADEAYKEGDTDGTTTLNNLDIGQLGIDEFTVTTTANDYIYLAIAKNTDKSSTSYTANIPEQANPASSAEIPDKAFELPVQSKVWTGTHFEYTYGTLNETNNQFAGRAIQRKITCSESGTEVVGPFNSTLTKSTLSS